LKKGEKNKRAKRVEWTAQEDERIIHMKEKEGKGWADIAKCIKGKKVTACKMRYHDHLKKEETKKRIDWSAEEDKRIVQMKEKEGRSWPDIAKCLKGRTEGACKMRYRNHLKKKKGEKLIGDEIQEESAAELERYLPGTVEIHEDGSELVWL
jgi:cyanate lyase